MSVLQITIDIKKLGACKLVSVNTESIRFDQRGHCRGHEQHANDGMQRQ